MAHGFDDLNRLYDNHGNLRDSWSPDTKLIFDHDKNCLADQLADMRYSGLKLPKMEAQGENIADNVGIRIAYATYAKWLELQSQLQDTETLPNMPQSPQQLFYLSVAQTMCSDILEERRPAFVRNSVHPPNESRVFVMMANSKSFAEAFQCGNETKLSPPTDVQCTEINKIFPAVTNLRHMYICVIKFEINLWFRFRAVLLFGFP